ncbi:MAG: hypothetical protein IJR90_07390 [Clostridia bacterium]|nr:hypothetical protein [Clostridia bacterium]
MKKVVKRILIPIVSLLLLIAIFLCGVNLYQHIANKEFFAHVKKEFKIPGISEGLVQQGMFKAEDGNILVCGYMADSSAPRIYLLDPSGKEVKYVSLMKNQKPDTTHAGGLCVVDRYVLLCGDGGLNIYSYDDLLMAANGSEMEASGVLEIDCLHPAFCFADAERLYFGEFYREQNYPTDPSHHMDAPSGEKRHAILLVCDLDQLRRDNFSKAEYTAVLSIPDLAQGFASDGNGMFCVSSSYALALSHLRFYNDPTAGEPKGTFTINGREYPLYYLDTDNMIKDVTMFPMAEEIYFDDGKLFVINESASSKYIFGKITGGGFVYSYEY